MSINTEKNIGLIMADIDTIFLEGDVFFRSNRLCETVNNFIEIIGNETSDIQQQVYAPIHRLTKEEMRILIRNINYEFLLSFPTLNKKVTLYDIAYYVNCHGGDIPDSLMEKIAGFTQQQEAEVSYKIYVLGEMKSIIFEHFSQL